MLRVTTSDPSSQFISFVRAWFDLLADGRFAEACAQLDEPNSYGIAWTAEAIQALLIDTVGPGTRFGVENPEGPIVTHTALAEGTSHFDVLPFDDGSGYSVYHDVPLNGQWSDLTAQFEFLARSDGFAVILHDLHVM